MIPLRLSSPLGYVTLLAERGVGVWCAQKKFHQAIVVFGQRMRGMAGYAEQPALLIQREVLWNPNRCGRLYPDPVTRIIADPVA